MWSYRINRRATLTGLSALGFLAACGFRPAFGPNGAAGALFEAVALPDPVTRDDFALNNRLRARLGAAAAPKWDLTHTISTSQQGFSASETARIQLVGDLSFRLTPRSAENRTFTGRVSAFVAYNEGQTSATNTNTPVSTVAAAADARARLMVQLADRLIEDLIVQMAGGRG